MLSQRTSCKSRDRGGAGEFSALFASVEAVESLTTGALAVVLDASGLPLADSMSYDDIAWAASVGLALIGVDEAYSRQARHCQLNVLRLGNVISYDTYRARQRRVWFSLSRRRVALGLASRYRSRHAIAAFWVRNGMTDTVVVAA